MASFADLDRSLGAVPGSVVMRLSRIDTGRGREELYRNQLPALLTELALRARKFKQERGRLPDIKSQDAWERRMAEGVAVLARHVAQSANV